MQYRPFAALIVGALLASCDAAPAGPQHLSDWSLFEPGTHTPVAELIPYEILAPLFSDYASKHRYVWLPPGSGPIEVVDGHWEFPIGTILVKSFAFERDMSDDVVDEDLIETRLIVREDDGVWRPYVYIWNEDETDAELVPAGRIVPVTFTSPSGEEVSFDYRVPSHTQCRNCHGGRDTTHPLGPRTAQMDVLEAGDVSQLQRFVDAGALEAMPPAESVTIVDYRPVLTRLDTATDDEIDDAARSYLHANCSHCHREGGGAQQSALWLRVDDEALQASDPSRLGLCRLPIAGGCDYGSVTLRPGHPEDSILMCRIESTRAGDRMPELPSVLVYHEGIELIREWIRRMPEDLCTGSM